MKRSVRVFLTMVTVVLLLSLFLVHAGAYEFTRAKGIRVPTLSQEAFTNQFGNNPDIRSTDQGIISLGAGTVPSSGEKAPAQPGCKG